MKKYFFLFVALTVSITVFAQKEYQIRTVAFYNLENLFDTINDPKKYDEASPIMEYKGDKADVYWKKIDNMAKVVSLIGTKDAKNSPVVIGVSEIENRSVLEDLINTSYLKNKDYGIIHYESPDARGIDVALLYQKAFFNPVSHKSYRLKIFKENGKPKYTRDQLLVSGYLDGELMHFIVNHWPSRSGGEKKSSPLREAAAKLNVEIIAEIQATDPEAKIITMGDFNDDPTNKSIKKILKAKSKKAEVSESCLYNPMEDMHRRGLNTLGYRDNINLFDQILFTGGFLAADKDYSTYKMYKTNIYNPKYLINSKGRYKGYPYRSWSYGNFTGGYSDHYPVYMYLIKEVEK
ncbi:MAG TPA: hypothetical protein VJ970_07490 [Flavobacteriaceae bacterium]|nr:hypothetical protein [Flavobacteriaceae bacterium]